MNNSPRLLLLRYPAVCATCGAALERGSQAWWDTKTKHATCREHPVDLPSAGNADDPVPSAEVTGPADPPVPPIPVVDGGVAGASAQRELERRRGKREERIRQRFGRFGGLVLALTDDPQSTRAWGTGAAGERKVGSLLARWFTEDEAIVLHDRRVPRSRGNIDHIVIAPSGVFVVDAKKYRGKVAKRDVGGFFKKDERLFVGRRDCSRLVEGVQKQVTLVQRILLSGEVTDDPPVIGVLCFVDAEWSLFAKPFEVDGITVTWPKALRTQLTAEQVLEPGARTRIGTVLSAALPPA